MRHAAPTAGSALRVNLLGRLEARTRDDRLIPMSGRHAQALFALLVLSRRPRSREAIAADLWPDSDATSSGALRQALWLVRHGLNQAGVDPHAILEIEPDTLGIRPGATVDLDTTAFEAASTDRLHARHGARALPRRPRRGPGPRLLRRRARTPGGPVRGCPRVGRRGATSRPAITKAPAAPPNACSSATRCARRSTRSSSRSTACTARARRWSASTGACAPSSTASSTRRPLPETDAIYRLALSRTVDRSLERAVTLDPVASARPALVVAALIATPAGRAPEPASPRRGRLGSHGRMPTRTRSRFACPCPPASRSSLAPRRLRRRRLQLERRRQPAASLPVRPSVSLRPAADRARPRTPR